LRPFGIFTAIWYILWPFDIFCGHLVYFCGHLVYFVTIWYFRVIWYIFSVLVCCTKVNLATLNGTIFCKFFLSPWLRVS
jgi:hypothetical protein